MGSLVQIAIFCMVKIALIRRWNQFQNLYTQMKLKINLILFKSPSPSLSNEEWSSIVFLLMHELI